MTRLEERFKEFFEKGLKKGSDGNVSMATCGESLAQVHCYNDKGKDFFVVQTRKVVIEKDENNKEYTHNIQVEQCIEFSAETFILVFFAMTEFLGIDDNKED